MLHHICASCHMYIPTALTDACCRDGLHISEMLSCNLCTFQRCCEPFRDFVHVSQHCSRNDLIIWGWGKREGGVAGLWGGEGWGVKVETSYALNFLLELPTCSWFYPLNFLLNNINNFVFKTWEGTSSILTPVNLWSRCCYTYQWQCKSGQDADVTKPCKGWQIWEGAVATSCKLYGTATDGVTLFLFNFQCVFVPPVHLLSRHGLVKDEKHQKHRERSQNLLTNGLPSELFSSRIWVHWVYLSRACWFQSGRTLLVFYRFLSVVCLPVSWKSSPLRLIDACNCTKGVGSGLPKSSRATVLLREDPVATGGCWADLVPNVTFNFFNMCTFTSFTGLGRMCVLGLTIVRLRMDDVVQLQTV